MNAKSRTALIFLAVLLAGSAQAQTVVSASELQGRLAAGGDTTFVVNFWATWCAPCIKEFPELEKFNGKGLERVKLLMVSIDKESKLKSVVQPFVRRHSLSPEIVLLPDPNNLLSKIYPKWSGNIPVTWIFNASQKRSKILDQTVTCEGLLKELQ